MAPSLAVPFGNLAARDGRQPGELGSHHRLAGDGRTRRDLSDNQQDQRNYLIDWPLFRANHQGALHLGMPEPDGRPAMTPGSALACSIWVLTFPLLSSQDPALNATPGECPRIMIDAPRICQDLSCSSSKMRDRFRPRPGPCLQPRSLHAFDFGGNITKTSASASAAADCFPSR
jgi:hypothetical protein